MKQLVSCHSIREEMRERSGSHVLRSPVPPQRPLSRGRAEPERDQTTGGKDSHFRLITWTPVPSRRNAPHGGKTERTPFRDGGTAWVYNLGTVDRAGKPAAAGVAVDGAINDPEKIMFR